MYLDKKKNGEAKRGEYLEKEKEENIWRRKKIKIFGEGKRGECVGKE